MTGQKIRYKKSCSGSEQVWEAGWKKIKLITASLWFQSVYEKGLDKVLND